MSASEVGLAGLRTPPIRADPERVLTAHEVSFWAGDIGRHRRSGSAGSGRVIVHDCTQLPTVQRWGNRTASASLLLLLMTIGWLGWTMELHGSLMAKLMESR